MRELGHIERAGSRRGIGADTTCRSMRRRWLFALGAAALASPFAAFAQQSGKSPRVGFLYYGSRQSAIEAGRYPAFVEGMRDLGYVEGKNLLIESRYAEGKPERASALATELASLKVDVIVATGSQTYRALQLATSTVPIVVTVGVDPVAGGYAATMARPGRNFTGLTDTAADLNPKLLELLMAVTSKLAPGGAPAAGKRVSSATTDQADAGRAKARCAGRAGRSRHGGHDRCGIRIAIEGARERRATT